MDPDASATALHVDGFDAEQIWGQLDTSGVALLRRARKLMARSGEAETLLLPAAAARLEGAHASQMTGMHLSPAPSTGRIERHANSIDNMAAR